MRALHFDGHAVAVVDKPRPSVLGTAEALVRVTRSGLCSTDREVAQGYGGFTGTLGHELVGVVEEAPDAPRWIGRRVVAEINAACRACPTCRSGLPNHCPSRTVLGIRGRDGAHAELVRVPIVNLHTVPASLPDERAVFCEPLAAAFQPLEQGVGFAPDEPIVVVGDGKLGLLQATVLQMAGADVTLLGRHERKAAIARSWGLRVSPPGSSALTPSSLRIVAECTGSPDGLAVALDLLAPRGTLILKSTLAADAALSLAPIVVKELTVVGSRCGPFPAALAALAAGRVPVEDLVDATYPLREGAAAFQHAWRPGVLKVLLRPSD